MKLNIAICDDEIEYSTSLKKLLTNYEVDHCNTEFNIDMYTSGEELVAAYQMPRKYDIVFLDVEMNTLDGIETANKIRTIPDDQVKIIFISNYPEYMKSSFSVQAFDYLTKPVNPSIFNELLDRTISKISYSSYTRILIKKQDSSEIIELKDLIYVKSSKTNRNQLVFVLTDKSISIRGTIADWEKDLENNSFISPHRGYLVNINHIHYIQKSMLIMTNGDKISIGRSKEKNIIDLFTKHVIETAI